jgi:hypothetical protein
MARTSQEHDHQRYDVASTSSTLRDVLSSALVIAWSIVNVLLALGLFAMYLYGVASEGLHAAGPNPALLLTFVVSTIVWLGVTYANLFVRSQPVLSTVRVGPSWMKVRDAPRLDFSDVLGVEPIGKAVRVSTDAGPLTFPDPDGRVQEALTAALSRFRAEAHELSPTEERQRRQVEAIVRQKPS